MSIYKEDISDAKERLNAWWDHELIDRPCILYYHPKPNVNFRGIYDFWYLAKNWDAIEDYINDYESKSESIYFGGENIPCLWPNYGPGIMASVLGVEPKFEYESRTVWFNRPTSVEDIVPLLESVKLNKNNPWYARLLRITEYAAKRARKDYCIAMTDLGGILDILSSFLGPINIILTMKRKPEVIDTCRSIILEKTLRVYDDLQTIIEQNGDGCMSWIPIWCPKRWYPIQSDISYILSPKLFKRFVLSDIVAQAEHMDYAIYHLDGPRQLPHLDDLLAEPSITGIQWVPGAGAESSTSNKWMPIYKKIQAARKNLIIDNPTETPNTISHLYKKLDPKGIITVLVFLTEMDADFYLPEFIGGKGGIGDYKAFKKEYRRKRIKRQSSTRETFNKRGII